MYYVLECYGPDEEDRAGLGEVPDYEGINWNLGKRFRSPPPTPIRVELDPDAPGIMVPMFKRKILLMSDDMINALKAAGVDNLDLYDAVILNPASGKTFKNYKAVNIIGLVAAADLPSSTYEAASGSPVIDVDFESLVIDENKAHGLPMFRLAECVTAIIIHERVRKKLEEANIRHLDFIKPEEWFG